MSVYLKDETGNRIYAGWTDVRLEPFEAQPLSRVRPISVQLQDYEGRVYEFVLKEEQRINLQYGDTLVCNVDVTGWASSQVSDDHA